MKPIIAPSILSADFAYLAKDLEMVNRSEVCGKTVKEAFGCTSDDCATREIH